MDQLHRTYATCSTGSRDASEVLGPQSNHFRAGVVCFLFLNGEFDLIHKRMSQRLGHYMPNGLLDTQFRTLEKPQADEADVITLAITASVEDLVSQSLIVLQSYRVRQLKYSGL